MPGGMPFRRNSIFMPAVPGTLVFTGNAPIGAFTDLDMSATVGSNRAVCLFRVHNNDGALTNQIYFRENGVTDSIGLAAAAAGTVPAGGTYSNYYVCSCDANGIVEWIGTNAIDTQIYLIAWWRP